MNWIVTYKEPYGFECDSECARRVYRDLVQTFGDIPFNVHSVVATFNTPGDELRVKIKACVDQQWLGELEYINRGDKITNGPEMECALHEIMQVKNDPGGGGGP